MVWSVMWGPSYGKYCAIEPILRLLPAYYGLRARRRIVLVGTADGNTDRH